MAHESFEDPQIAARMNELFVNIKVDREERPDLDPIYQHALALMGEQGGWPLTMFLTPDGEPFWGGTYFPPEPRWGRPGFPQVLRRDQRGLSRTSATTSRRTSPRCARRCSGSASREPGGGDRAGSSSTAIAERLLREIDQITWRHRHRAEIPAMRHLRAVVARLEAHPPARPIAMPCVKALDAMCQGGIYDHLGGGFARYSTDARWLAPHFEKMLYDNAELVDLLTLVWQETEEPALSPAGRRDDRLGRARDADPGRRRSPAASMPTASTRKASSTSGPRPRSTRCSATAPPCSSAFTT